MRGYKELMGRFRVATSATTWDPVQRQSVPIDPDAYDVILNKVCNGYACEIYEVKKNAPGLSDYELALICDEGNLCFG